MGLRYFWYRFKYRYGKNLPLTVPVDVSLELSSDCNMKCTYCYHGDPDHLPFNKGIMRYPTAEKIIRQSAELGVNSLKFNWKGESTINPHFLKITTLAKDLAHGSTFMDRLTNSNFKFRTDKEDIFKGLCNQTKVKVSYDSFKKEVFEKQRAGGDHDLTTRNIDKFYNYPGRTTELVLQAVRTQANKDEDIQGEAKRRWPSAQLSIRDMVSGRLEKSVSDMETKHRDSSTRQSCQQAHVRILFNYKGDAYPCCPDIKEELKIGSIHRESVQQIFNSAQANRIRGMLKDGSAFNSLPACKGCSSFETYKGFQPVWNS